MNRGDVLECNIKTLFGRTSLHSDTTPSPLYTPEPGPWDTSGVQTEPEVYNREIQTEFLGIGTGVNTTPWPRQDQELQTEAQALSAGSSADHFIPPQTSSEAVVVEEIEKEA